MGTSALRASTRSSLRPSGAVLKSLLLGLGVPSVQVGHPLFYARSGVGETDFRI